MRLHHFGTVTHAMSNMVVDDFGNEHNLILGDGDFGGISCTAFVQAAAFSQSAFQEPEVYEALWGTAAGADSDAAPAEDCFCGGCNGSGRMPRDPDIGTDQECFVCEGSGHATEPESDAGVGTVPIANGGPAYPCAETSLNNATGEATTHQWSSPGITVRDYFAARAMQGAFTGPPIPCTADEQAYIAMHAYRMADAMLAAREKQS